MVAKLDPSYLVNVIYLLDFHYKGLLVCFINESFWDAVLMGSVKTTVNTNVHKKSHLKLIKWL